MKRLALTCAAWLFAGSTALAASVLAPSGVMARPVKLDRQNISVIGTVSNLLVRPIGPGTYATQFELCDSMCINVIAFGPPKVSNGQTATANGTFYVFFARGPVQAHDIIVVGAGS
jgi:hypothetical protein